MKTFSILAAAISVLAASAAWAQSSGPKATCRDVFNYVTSVTHDQSNPEYERGLKGKFERLENSPTDIGSRIHALKVKPALEYSSEAELMDQAEQPESTAPGLHLIDFYTLVKQKRPGASLERVKELLAEGDKSDNMTFCKFKGRPLDSRDPKSYRLWHEDEIRQYVIVRLPNVEQKVTPGTSMSPAGTIADGNPKAALVNTLGGYMGQLNQATPATATR